MLYLQISIVQQNCIQATHVIQNFLVVTFKNKEKETGEIWIIYLISPNIAKIASF